ncbi:methyltransferase domain-containing protein [Azohydromonas lata]|uniref:Biotin synthase n=1 Tax=Azohydromonas lata TaxID=45677 RepID=A0ABU5IBL2_9BURK|nr:biotin synthase [Azohydromonas lata]MDZ5456476.1 biotin synthase [Azohydromonas lata]
MNASTDSTPSRAFDTRAAQRAVRRMAAAEQPPWLHAEAARRMAERLPMIRRTPQTVLQWSSFLGASEAVLRDAYPQARLLAVEPAEVLEARSVPVPAPWWSPKRWAGPAAVTLLDEQAVAPGSAELLWSNMALHGEADPTALLARWHAALAVDGFLMFSTFGAGTLAELRGLYRERGWGSPMADFVDMHDLGDMLVHAGFADPVMDQETVRLTWADAAALLAELRGLGANADPRRVPGLRTPRWQARLGEALQALAGTHGRPVLSFELVYGHAFKAAPRPRVAERTEVGLEEMRQMVRSRRT